MSGKLTRSAYENLIAEDIKWLLEQERTLERDHILDVLMDSPGCLYDFDEVNHDTFRGLPQSRKNDKYIEIFKREDEYDIQIRWLGGEQFETWGVETIEKVNAIVTQFFKTGSGQGYEHYV